MMNFEGLDPGLGEYTPGLHGGLEPGLDSSMDPRLDPSLLQGVDLDPDALAVPVSESMHILEGMYSELHSVAAEVGIPVTATHFDLQEELLWMGNHRGHASSFFGTTMGRYSSFQVHMTDDIRHIQSMDTGVLFLTKNNLKCLTRGGLIMFDYTTEEGADMHSLILTDNNTLLMGGLQNFVTELDLTTVQETQKFTVEVPGVAIMRQSNRFFFCGHTSGKVSLRDLRTFKMEYEFDAFSGSLSDFDVNGNLLAACGFSSRGLNGMSCDRFLMVYDLRMMRAITPLQVHVDPLFLRFIPTYTSRLAIISQTGQCQFCEPTGLANLADIFHVNTVGQLLMSFEVSSSKQALSFGDSGGCVHLWSSAPEVSFNSYSRETELALPCLVDSLPQLDWNHELMPLSLLPMSLTSTEPLLSDWPTSFIMPSPRRAPPVDPEILRTMKTVGFIGYAPNPRTRPRNQVPYKIKDTELEYDSYNQVPESPIGRDEEPHLYMVPKKYRKVTIKYSKLGLEDFDFKHYNRTLFAGLEPHIPNAYCNCMIQVLYFLEPVRCLVQNHLCQKEFCLACELGFLFHMLDLSRGDPCQASNFLRAFRTIPEASALGLILADSDEQTGKARLGRLIQSWNRFILAQLHQETLEQEGPQAYRGASSSSTLGSSGESVIGRLFGCEVENSSLCRCGKETVRSSLTLLFTMHYPEQSSPDKTIEEYDFAEILKKSICLEQSTQAWCDNCEKYQPTVQTRNIRCLPDVLVINCEVNSAKEAEFWKAQTEYAYNKALKKEAAEPPKPKEPLPTEWCLEEELCSVEGLTFDTQAEDMRHVWIPLSLKMCISKTQGLEVSSLSEGEELTESEEAEGASVYDLVVTVSHIQDARTGGNLVVHIKVGETYHQRKEGVTHQQWYLFNDFLIEPIDKAESAQFDMNWKVPAVLYYVKRNSHPKYDLRIKNPIDASVLLTEASLARKQRKSHATFIPLMVSEMPQAADLVGLDAEFVTLNQEEAELRSDGTKSTIKPSQMSVARITCVRGQGPNEGVPFIDDYISTQEQVVDYLTQYSGIKPGDLDVKISSKHLTTLKSTYLKLRFLIDTGVRFVGHGLQKDFRVINLMVPKEQVIDTVYLFHMPRKRMISLRFLAWYFLDLNIQSETHDSIEDARTALQLYRKYLELSHNGGQEEFRKVLKALYEKGRKLDWKVPDIDSADGQGTAMFPSVMGL
ncbi:PAN2-PAN3 deadenylation complex catalytic subunit PAN2 isoform X1 [Carassius auratus]|uniref:PAN2-PAN3 deadenylation complex catalytic subunit PAN2 n=1 Tax=Carassius auratus TaxID=7957 RepID=A0A6P6J5Z7_CARAU|nr:PAN2-PAN3 deadenylation complex catalytic subunit PAN2-like isoform X1 [Carassius auratus]XP_026055669.1 PAN2-PAN3 deadenylation complex catalytic subunit PAN2-like isoform X1 [Carassius auratus]XP_026055670.1 PAN2-PAN3 deadenylation complex catalytic subunit PAN2-like isoform X1 [Carassius auratus]XP_026055671.1 PAN2-PAN3 deadenylation complex catalytic subunit PAN2-like isoform X1 [Carassius auratus]